MNKYELLKGFLKSMREWASKALEKNSESPYYQACLTSFEASLDYVKFIEDFEEAN